jgi:hypothetical protein
MRYLLFLLVFSGCVLSDDEKSRSTPDPIPEYEWVREWQLERDEIHQIPGKSFLSWCGLEAGKTWTFRWELASNLPIDVLAVPSKADKEAYIRGEAYNQYPTLVAFGSLKYNRSGTVASDACLILRNTGSSPATVTDKYSVETLVYRQKKTDS